jgi:cytidine deaminase
MKKTDNKLFKKAVAARLQSYSPYSKHKVGSAIELTNGQVFSGCNVENASYGGTVCAERVAIWSAVAKLGPKVKIKSVCVVTDVLEAWPPCGLCRQIINEFATAKTLVFTGNLEGVQKTFKFSELLPESFGPAFLRKK